MGISKRLQEIERAVGITYPSSFVSGVELFSELLSSEGFRRAFSDSRLLLSAPEIEAVRENIPASFLPFMRQEQPSWPDIYAFDIDSTSPEFRVIVWSDHAVVMDWESFPVFIQWVIEHIAKYDRAA